MHALDPPSSMSEVALGPETSVSGRPAAAASPIAATASGTDPTTCSARTTHACQSGTSVSARRPESGAAVEHDRPGLGHGQRAAAEHAVDAVERGRRQRAIGDELEPVGPPGLGHARRNHQAPRAPLARQDHDALGDLGLGEPVHGRAVLGHALGEAVHARRPAPARERIA